MSIRTLAYYSIIICLLGSCATLKSDQFVEKQIALTKDNLELLNGKYSRASITRPNRYGGDLFGNFYDRGFNIGADSLCFVDIKVIDKKHLKVNLLKEDSIIKSKVLKGKIKNGYFEMRRKKLVVPTLYLNVFRTSKFRVGLLENNNLTTDYKQISWGTGFFIIPFYEKEAEFDFEYKKYLK